MYNISQKGYGIVNIDSVLVAQAPKLAPVIPDIRASLAKRMGLAVDQVGLKATTTEKMGFEGRKEGMSCQAVVLLQALDASE